MSAECPYCPPFDVGWGMGPEGYKRLGELHDAGHPSREASLVAQVEDVQSHLRQIETRLADALKEIEHLIKDHR
jgi:hypothetical protein